MVARKSASDESWPNGMRSTPSSITPRPVLIPARRLRTAPRANRSTIAGRRARAASTPDATMESDLAIVRIHHVTRPRCGQHRIEYTRSHFRASVQEVENETARLLEGPGGTEQ